MLCRSLHFELGSQPSYLARDHVQVSHRVLHGAISLVCFPGVLNRPQIKRDYALRRKLINYVSVRRRQEQRHVSSSSLQIEDNTELPAPMYTDHLKSTRFIGESFRTPQSAMPGLHDQHDHYRWLKKIFLYGRVRVLVLNPVQDERGADSLQQFTCIQVTKLTQKSAVELASKGGTRGGKGRQRGAAVGAAVGAANICGGGTFPFWVGSWGRQCNYVTKGGSVTMRDNGRQWAARAAVCIKIMVQIACYYPCFITRHKPLRHPKFGHLSRADLDRTAPANLCHGHYGYSVKTFGSLNGSSRTGIDGLVSIILYKVSEPRRHRAVA
ncbi:hypothetical protein B0H14DRAFT_2590727 [Mycena olivaceomarginata]|nr:hypothetical protein B0H14DRAFT_2590727 [Mycena olivaceomarginata]